MYIESFLRLGGFKKSFYGAFSLYFSSTCHKCAAGQKIGKFHQKWTNLPKKSKICKIFSNGNPRNDIGSTNTTK